MAKRQSLYPAQLDNNENWAPSEGLEIDRQPSDRFTSDAWDLIEDSILEIEKELGTDPAGTYATIDAWLTALQADIDGFPDELKNLITHEIQQLETLGGVTTISAAQWANLGANRISDNDGDTIIHTEEAADEDILRFDTAGNQRLAIHDGWINQHFNNLLDPYGGMESWSGGVAVAPDGWTLSVAAAESVAQEIATHMHGNFAANVLRGGADCNLYRVIEEFTYYQNRIMTLGCWVYATAADRGRIQIDDGVATSESAYHTGVAGWEWLTVTRTIDNAATSVTVRLLVDNDDVHVIFDGAVLVEGQLCPTYMPALKTIFLTTSITDAAWIGAGRSTSEADIDLSAFGNGCPPNIKAVYIYCAIRDSGSAANSTYILFGPAGIPMVAVPDQFGGVITEDLTNDTYRYDSACVPCIAGDIRYKINASAAGTMDVHLHIMGYVLGE